MATSLESLLGVVRGSSRVLILPHTNPDPDAIASSVALGYLLGQQLGVATQIAYKGIIGRAENRALVRYLQYPLKKLSKTALRGKPLIALVDTQPGVGNNALDQTTPVHLVFDHHPKFADAQPVLFSDVRPQLGATATILTEYLQATGIPPPPNIATALFYGIKTDTLGLLRGATEADIDAYLYLQPYVDTAALIEIEHAQVPAAYFRQLDTTIQSAQVYQDVVIAYIGVLAYPDLVGEMADTLLRLEGMRWSICMGQHQDTLLISVRTRDRHGDAGFLVRAVVRSDGTAGGHGMLAGGQIVLGHCDAAQLAQNLTRRMLKYLAISPHMSGVPIVLDPAVLQIH
jgi:nanoRNase/pAp phosphatase (c-di-AMP/oligoRNAs hydrolase)